jgi:hypothetical protein
MSGADEASKNFNRKKRKKGDGGPATHRSDVITLK